MRIFLLYVFFLMTLTNINAQEFTLNFETTDESCFADGQVQVTTENTVQGATIEYILFKLPEEIIPFSTGVGDMYLFYGLPQGNYKIVVNQSIGGNVLGTEEGYVTINNLMASITPQTIEIISDVSCNEGTITVNLYQGVAEYYRLLIEMPIESGNFVEIAAPQTSNEFYITSTGNYRVAIKDAICGNEILITQTVIENELDVFIWQNIFCDNQDVYTIQAVGGVAPYTYQLVDTDEEGNIIVITDNGEDNVFFNIGFGLRMFMVTDGCGISAIIETSFEEPDNGDLFFSSQSQINEFSDLDCEVISGNLTISGEDINDLNALNSITHINGDLIIINCPLLTNLDDFVNLISLGGSFVSGKIMNSEDQPAGGLLKIENNPLLSDISGLVNIASNTIAELIIVDNPLLSVCSLSNFCSYLSNQDNLRTIEGNTNDCLDNQSVVIACALMSVDTNNLSSVNIYPNPVNQLLNFSKQVQKITLTDLTGKILLVQNNSNQIDMSNFQKGVYLITIEQEDQLKATSKIIKQ